MEKDRTKIDRLILSFLEGSIASSELQLLRNWVKESVENKTYFRRLEETWLISGTLDGTKQFHKEQAFRTFRDRIEDRKRPRKPLFTLKRVVSYAACILLIFMTGIATPLLMERLSMDKKLLTYSVETPRKAKLKINLPDGSLVWLNAESTLHYNNQFGISNRELSLQGEGYFEISKNPELPLVVTSGNAKVKVLGTKFNMQNYQNDDDIRVALLEGSIDFSDNRYEKSILLKPNQMINYNKRSGILRVKNIDATYSNAWIKDTVFFNEEKLEKIAKVIERAFDITVQFENETLKNLVFYGDITIEAENIVQIMDIMSATNKFSYRYDIEKRVIHISH